MSSPDITRISAPFGTDYQLGIPSGVRDVSYQIIGTPGSATYYYWIIANYNWGTVQPIAPLVVRSAPNILSASNAVLLSWLVPSVQVISYTILRTTSAIFPGTSITAVSVSLSATTFTDTGGALTSFTFTPLPTMRGATYIAGTGPAPVLMSSIGVSTTSSSGGNIPAFRTYTITLVGSNWQIVASNGTITSVPTAAATGQQIPLDTLPANAYLMFSAISVTAGPVGGTTSAAVDGVGISGSPTDIVSILMDLQTVPNTNDTTTSVGRLLFNTPLPIFVHITSTTNINLWTPPCSFIVSLLWAVPS